jgi:hypothetical protein
MLSLLWSALNALLLLGIIYILYRAAKLLKQHLGWGAALFFVFALLMISSRSSTNQSGPPQNLLSDASKSGPVANASAHQTIDLKGTNKLSLVAEYDSSNGKLVPRGLYATVSGFVFGHNWKPGLGMLQQQGTQLQYWVTMNHEWLLLNLPIFTQDGEEFQGTMQ